MSNRPYHHGDLRNALVASALDALTQEGSMPGLRELARRCGVSRTAPYRHFRDLETLRGAVVAEAFMRLTEHIQARVNGSRDPWRGLQLACQAYIEFGLANPALYGLMFGPDTDWEQYAPAELASEEARAALRGAIRICGVESPDELTFTAWTALHGAVSLMQRDESERPTRIAAVIDMVLAYTHVHAV